MGAPAVRWPLIVAAVLLATAGQALAHVALNFPVPATPIDFTDNFRTSGFCGHDVSGNDNSNLWRLPPIDPGLSTPLKAGSTVNMSWNLHYPHNGGYELDIYRIENGTLGERIMCEKKFGCSADGTANTATVTLPDVTCDTCLVRLRRQALEWGGNYLFSSCAMVSISEAVDECQGCSGNGNCVKGQCQCDSSPETGFWYGDYCNQENECELDMHCGRGGVCQDSESPTAPRKQCFCEESWFGREAKTPSGMSVRKCTERSSLTLGDPSQWGQEYPESRTSTPTGNITIYWKVDEGAGFIEYAIAAVTDAWVAVGTRPESVSNVGTTPAGLPASETQGESEGQPEAEGEAEGQPEAEGEPEGQPAAEGEPEGQPEAEGEPEGQPAAEGEPEGQPEAEGEPEGEAEGQPEGEAEGEVESESGSSSQVCTNFPGSEDSTTCPRPSTGAALTVIKVLPAVEPEAENEPEGESETEPAAEAETVAEPSSNRRLLANRRLLDGHGEPEPEAEAEGQPEADGYVHKDGGDALRIPGETPCNALIVSGSAHPMVNIDIVVGAAIGNTFRVYDAFTPSRSRPLPDAVFGGQDDILDAVGKETTDGDGNPLTLIRFRKPLVSQDAAADYCIVRDVRYRMLYAYGQSSPRGAVFHAPASALETGTGKNTGFYRPDALLFHGGGISSGRYDTRGSFAGIDFFPNTGACAPSTLAPTSTGSTFDCQLELAMGYTLHWTADVNAGTVRMAAQAPTTAGWVALGFPTNGAAMAGALVVLGSPDNIKTYRLPGYTPPGAGWPEEAIEGLNPSSLALTRTPTHTIIEFERREVPGVFELAGEQPLIAAYNLASHVHTNIHSSGTNQGFFWSAAGEGEPDACPPRSPNWSLYVAHGALMCAAWGVFIPVGVVIAGTLKDKDPLWFQCHRGINLAGLVVAAAAWILALAKFGPLISGGSGDGLASAHTVIGMIVMILGILQPVNAFFRPHKGEKNRWIFNWVHWTSGRVAWFGGLLNVFIGIFLFRERDGRCSPNWPIYVYAAWLFVYACIWAGLEIRKAKGGRVDAEEKPAKLEG